MCGMGLPLANVGGWTHGQVIEHPLADWAALETFEPPPTNVDAQQVRARYEATRRRGNMFTRGSGGNFFERVHYLRGYENLLMDLAGDTPSCSGSSKNS